MPSSTGRRALFGSLRLVSVGFALGAAATGAAPRADAQLYPFRCHGVADGLPSERITALHEDRKGYLWIGTWEGLSRFDGERFVNYGTTDGLTYPIVNDLAEDAAGTLWIGVHVGGLARFDDAPPPAETAGPAGPVLAGGAAGDRRARPRRRTITSFAIGEGAGANVVGAVGFAPGGEVWLTSGTGLLRGAGLPPRDLELVVPSTYPGPGLRANDGRLWFGGRGELQEVRAGRLIRHPLPSPDEVAALAEQDGALLVATRHALYRWDDPPHGGLVPIRLELLAGQQIEALAVGRAPASRGVLWVGTSAGLVRLDAGGRRSYTRANGLAHDIVNTLLEDRDGVLWIGTFGGGLCRLAGEAAVTLSRGEEAGDANFVRVIESAAGRVYAATRQGIVAARGDAVTVVPGSTAAPFAGAGTRLLQDRRGDWWVGTDAGLWRFDGPELQLERGRRIGPEDGLPAGAVFSNLGAPLVEDADGRVWLSLGGPRIWRIDPGPPLAATAVPLDGAEGVADVINLAVDPGRGDLWLGGFLHLARRRAGTRAGLTVPGAAEGLPDTQVRDFFFDRRGWLWLGMRYRGLAVARDPGAPRPRFESYTSADGLASDTVWSIAEDRAGALHLCTSRGLDRIEGIDSGRWRIEHLARSDGLAGDQLNDCLLDRRGDLWVAADGGLSRLRFGAAGGSRLAGRPPSTLLSRLRVAGEELPLPETGIAQLAGLVLPGARRHLAIEWVGVSLLDRPRFEHRLLPVERAWSEPRRERSASWSRLPPGSYRFEVRASSGDGRRVGAPAVLEMLLPPPFWRTWWFLAALLGALGAAVYATHRYRVGQLLALERVRTRIASDLHDDIGAGLSQIAILSEVARRDDAVGSDRAADPAALARVADTARELVESMSDIVWAVNPARDTLHDLVGRMRRFAADTLGAGDVELRFSAPADSELALGPELRRELLLVAKELVNNAARHAGAATVEIELVARGGELRLTVADDGVGFAAGAPSAGHGLASLGRRAARLGGRFAITARPGGGSVAELVVPLAPPKRRETARPTGSGG